MKAQLVGSIDKKEEAAIVDRLSSKRDREGGPAAPEIVQRRNFVAKIDNQHLESANPNGDDAVARRSFLKYLAALSVTASVGNMSLLAAAAGQTFDYIVVGAGPGGGPLAANLARAGYTVALLEAGLDPGSAAAQQLEPNVLGTYSVPAFVAISEEDPLLSWDFYVNHYSQNGQRDPKFVPGKGVLYPRGSCLGGSSGHNFMVFMYPHDDDFDRIARLTGDESWRPVFRTARDVPISPTAGSRPRAQRLHSDKCLRHQGIRSLSRIKRSGICGR